MHVVVIGAGIVGTATALELLRDNHQVMVLEPGDPGGEQAASYGNGVAYSHRVCSGMLGSGRGSGWGLSTASPMSWTAPDTLYSIPRVLGVPGVLQPATP
jgi:glycine/D-amino acid oxidase-like deaminating enzyme